MPARIVTLPARPAQDEVDSRIRQYLSAMSSDPELIETVALRMKFFIDRFAGTIFRPVFDLAVPAGISKEEAQALLRSVEKGVDAAAEQVEKMVCEIVIERLFIEVENYQYRKEGKSDGDPAHSGTFSPSAVKHKCAKRPVNCQAVWMSHRPESRE